MSEASMRALAAGREQRWPSFEERFESNVDRTGECWLWMGANVRGYGFIERDGQKVMAHRAAFEMENGPIPDGFQVDHVCHTRSCVRPAHLRLATNKQNSENKGLISTNSSGYRGVVRYRDGIRWVAQVKHNQRNLHLGIFDTAEEAAEVARARRLELFTHNDADHTESQWFSSQAAHRIWPESD